MVLYQLMKTFSISTLGCKVNQYESQQIRQLLQERGLHQVQPESGPDLLVVNTCCVTATASAKCRQFIRKNQRLYPDSMIIVCGCLPTLDTEELPDLGSNIHLVPQRQDLAACLSTITQQTTSTDSLDVTLKHQVRAIRPDTDPQIKSEPGDHLVKLPQLLHFAGQTRAFLKVQDGCDGYCAYCIIPKTRSELRSKPVDLAVQEARNLVASGHKEIVVTGVFIGAYKRITVRRRHWNSPDNFALYKLLNDLAVIDGLARLRISSLEPADLTPTLVDLMATQPNMVPHVHLSLQSGSNRILKKMGRQYSRDDFLRVIEQIQARLDRPAITTDIIVGFPGETETDFEETCSLAQKVGFAKMHVFPFSARPQTPAARMPDQVPASVAQQRSAYLRKLDQHLARQYRTAFIGETLRILVEQDPPTAYGLSDRYMKVYLPQCDPEVRKNDLVQVRIRDHFRDGLTGIIKTILPNK